MSWIDLREFTYDVVTINRKRETTAPPGLPARLARSLPLAIYVYGTLNTIKSY